MTERADHHQNTEQPDNWLEHLFSQRNFDSQICHNIPILDKELISEHTSAVSRWRELRQQCTKSLIELLWDSNKEVRFTAAQGLSHCAEAETESALIELILKRTLPHRVREAAMIALSGSERTEVKVALADFIVDRQQSLSFSSSKLTRAAGSNSSTAVTNRKDVSLKERTVLINTAAESIGPIWNEQVIKKLYDISSSNIVKRLWETMHGVSKADYEMRLGGALRALNNPILIDSKYASALILQGLNSKNPDIKMHGLIAAFVNSNRVDERVRKRVFGILEEVGEDSDIVEVATYVGEVISTTKDQSFKIKIRELMASDSSLLRFVGLTAVRHSTDAADMEFVSSLLERAKTAEEEKLAIKILGDCLGKGPGSNNPGFAKAEATLIDNFNIFSQKSEENRAEMILALSRSKDPSIMKTCLDLIFSDNKILSVAARESLIRNQAAELNEILLGILTIKDEEHRHIVGDVAMILSKRPDPKTTEHLIRILEIGDDLECSYATHALLGTQNIKAIQLTLKIGEDRTRHPELRADAIYNLSFSKLDPSKKEDRQIQREIAKSLSLILADAKDDTLVRLSALNALPNNFAYKAIRSILNFAKGPDLVLADAAISKLSKFEHPESRDFFHSILLSSNNSFHRDLARNYFKNYPSIDTISLALQQTSSPETHKRAEMACILSGVYAKKSTLNPPDPLRP